MKIGVLEGIASLCPASMEARTRGRSAGSGSGSRRAAWMCFVRVGGASGRGPAETRWRFLFWPAPALARAARGVYGGSGGGGGGSAGVMGIGRSQSCSCWRGGVVLSFVGEEYMAEKSR